MSSAVEPGIRRTKSGWEVYARIKGEYVSKHFPPETELADMRRWREERKARAKYQIPDPVFKGEDFAADCRRYLAAVAGMTTFSDRKYRILLWLRELGPHRPRKEIEGVEIRHVLEKWRAKGASAGTLNLRRTALMHLFSVLDGKSGRNPVRDVPRYRETQPPLRLPTTKQAERAIAAIAAGNPNRIRLQVMLWTGWPPATLMRLTSEDVNFRTNTARVEARRKGTGVEARVLPLTGPAVTALKALRKAKAWGQFDTHNMRHQLLWACRRAGVKPFTPYALRHLFLTTVALRTKDDRAVAELAQHSDIRQTRRYTEQSVSPRLRAAVGRLK